MAEMSPQEIQEYLSILYDMYMHKQVQQKLAESIKQDISSLAQPRAIPRPTPPQIYSMLDDNTAPSPTPSTKEAFGIIIIIIAIGFLAAFAESANDTSTNWLTGIIIVIMIAIFFGWEVSQGKKRERDIMNENQKRKHLNQEANQRHEGALLSYKAQIEEEQQRISNEQVKKNMLQQELNELNARIAESDRNFQAMLDVNILYPKYRDLPAVSSIYEYFQTGQCNTLGEAYKLYEAELRAGIIINQLNQVLSDLQSIKQGQFALYQAIHEGNRIASQIMQNTSAILSHTDAMQTQVAAIADSVQSMSESKSADYAKMDLLVYNQQRIRQELEYLNVMNYYSGKYINRTYGFRPPSVRSIGEYGGAASHS